MTMICVVNTDGVPPKALAHLESRLLAVMTPEWQQMAQRATRYLCRYQNDGVARPVGVQLMMYPPSPGYIGKVHMCYYFDVKDSDRWLEAEHYMVKMVKGLCG